MSFLTLAFTGTNQSELVEWFVASVGLIVIVTLIYVFVLDRSPPPEGITEAKLEQQLSETADGSAMLLQTHTAILGGDYALAVDLACRSATVTLGNVLGMTGGNSGMNAADLAYLVQTKAKSCPPISESCYQLNLLHLKVAQGQKITQQEAEWAVSVANW